MKIGKRDVAKIESGDWIGDIPDMGNLRLHVRGFNTPKYRRLQQQLVAATPRAKRRKGQLDPVENDRITATCLLRAVLLGWENVEDENGQPVPYSEEQAEIYLTDPAYREFYEAVVWAATQVGEDDEEADKEDEGNSPRPSAGA